MQYIDRETVEKLAAIRAAEALQRQIDREKAKQLLIQSIKTGPDNRPRFYFYLMAISDIHLGTWCSRAEGAMHLLQNVCAKFLNIVGDAIDGEALEQKKKWKWPPGHRQVIAEIFEKIAQGTIVRYIVGNHDIALMGRENKNGKLYGSLVTPRSDGSPKTIFGIEFYETFTHTLENGVRIKFDHGQQFDGSYGKYSKAGTLALEWLSAMDTLVQRKYKNISVAAGVKKATKGIIDYFWKVRKRVAADTDNDPNVDIRVQGHTHRAELSDTPGGKTVVNTGSITEQVKAWVMFDNEAKDTALIEKHDDYIGIELKGKQPEVFTYAELGYPELAQLPAFKENIYTAMADRIARLIHRRWPPKERKEMVMRNAARGVTAATIPLPNPHYRAIASQPVRRFKFRPEALAA